MDYLDDYTVHNNLEYTAYKIINCPAALQFGLDEIHECISIHVFR